MVLEDGDTKHDLHKCLSQERNGQNIVTQEDLLKLFFFCIILIVIIIIVAKGLRICNPNNALHRWLYRDQIV